MGESVKKAAQLANDDSVIECVAGKHCDTGFCKARPVCRAYAEERQKMAVYDFKPAAMLTVAEIADIIETGLRHSKNWAKLVCDYALEQAYKHGVRIPRIQGC